MTKLKARQAVVVEGRDDVRALSEAFDGLVIATHGFGITEDTWKILEKAYKEKGLIILTDPDYAGENIRKRLTEKFPAAIQAYLDRGDAEHGGDIGIENAKPEIIKEALEKALELHGRNLKQSETDGIEERHKKLAKMEDLIALGLAGGAGASKRRARVCKALGIGYGNAQALLKKLKGFGIDLDELKRQAEKNK